MLGVAFLAITAGGVLAWAGYNDVDALQALNSIMTKKPLPDHHPGEGLARVGRAALVILALKTTAGALGGLLSRAGIPGVGGGSGGGEPTPGEVPGEPVPIEPVVPIATPPAIPPPVAGPMI